MKKASQEHIEQMTEMGKKWLEGKILIEEFNGIKLNKKQVEFIMDKNRFSLVSGGMASGKSLGWIVKFILISQWFPGTKILIGRKTKTNAAETFMKDFAELCPAGIYEYKVGDGKILFNNGTEAVFFGLDTLAGGGDDTKKAEQNIKSHNFGFIFIDQLEEIELSIFEALNSRVRRRMCKHGTNESLGEVKIIRDKKGMPIYEICTTCGAYTYNQFNLTTNPANFWAYDYFKVNPRPMTHLIETSMLDNRDNLPEQFIQSELAKPKRYVQKYVYGEWSDASLVDACVFYEEYLDQQQANIMEPLRIVDGIHIFEEPLGTYEYQIGIDASEGVIDPCAIKVFNKDTGEEAASFSGFIPIQKQVDIILKLAYLYSLKSMPYLVIETTGTAGGALLENIKNKYDYIMEREIYNYHEQKNTKKLGFSTNHQSKGLLIENFLLLLSKKCVKIRDKEMLMEMRHFVWTDEVKQKGAGAQKGFHDDRVMAAMLALWRANPHESPQRINFQNRDNTYRQTVRNKKTNLYS